MNEPLTERERRVHRMGLVWGFAGGIVLCVVASLIWELFT